MDRATADPDAGGPGRRAREWADRHHRHAATSTYVYEFVWDRSAPADGPFCTDVDGNVLLDFTSHVGAAPLGYNNPKILEPMAEFDLTDPLKIAGQDFYVANGPDPDDALPGPSALMERLTEITDHYDMGTVFLSNSGAEAVENAIKVCYDHTGGDYGLTFTGAFHGRTLGALSLNRSKAVYRRGFPEVHKTVEVPFCDDRGCTPETCGCGLFRDDGETTRLRDLLDPDHGTVHPDDVAYLILEPIQGEGGYRIPSDAFVEEVAAVADDHDLTVVADEIQAGMGRTGEWWASDHYPFDPDVITAAKSLRVGATVGRDEVFPEERSRLSSTWGGGDVVASMQGALTIDAIEDHDLLTNATRRGRQFVETVRDADPPGATDVRGAGLMLAVEFVDGDRRDDVQETALDLGLLTLGCGERTLRVLPPLDVTEREIDLGARLLVDAAEAVA